MIHQGQGAARSLAAARCLDYGRLVWNPRDIIKRSDIRTVETVSETSGSVSWLVTGQSEASRPARLALTNNTSRQSFVTTDLAHNSVLS
jgi:hypothetical protein